MIVFTYRQILTEQKWNFILVQQWIYFVLFIYFKKSLNFMNRYSKFYVNIKSIIDSSYVVLFDTVDMSTFFDNTKYEQ